MTPRPLAASLLALCLALPLLTGCGGSSPDAANAAKPDPNTVIARYADGEIKRGDIQRALDNNFASLPQPVTPEARQANQAMVDLLARVGARKHATPAQIALAWVLAQKAWIAPIPGTTKLHRLDENLGALDVKLSPAEIESLSSALPPGAAKGTRYPEGQMKSLYI